MRTVSARAAGAPERDLPKQANGTNVGGYLRRKSELRLQTTPEPVGSLAYGADGVLMVVKYAMQERCVSV